MTRIGAGRCRRLEVKEMRRAEGLARQGAARSLGPRAGDPADDPLASAVERIKRHLPRARSRLAPPHPLSENGLDDSG
jgi:hypothetical protein